MTDNKITDTKPEASQPKKINTIAALCLYIDKGQAAGDAPEKIRAEIDDANNKLAEQGKPSLTQAELEAEIYPLIGEPPILFKGLDETVTGLLEQIEELKAQGLDDDAIKRNIRLMNKEQCDPPLNEADLNEFVFGQAALDDDFVTLDQIKPEPIEWLSPPRIPKGEITIIGGDGGAGKTSLWVALAAAVASGRGTVFEQDDAHDDIPFDKPGDVMILTTEDSINKKLWKSFEAYSLNDKQKSHIYAIDASSWNIGKYTLDSDALRRKVDQIKPALVILDPLQGFLADGVDMSKRNQMRHALAPLKAMGAAYGTTFVIIMHTNKRQSVYGRGRLADSADMWDIARSVMLVGLTGKKDADGRAIRYLSTEKASYTACEDIETILFTLPGGRVKLHAVTDDKEADIIQERTYEKSETKAQPVRDEVKEEILDYLKENDGEVLTRELDDHLKKNLGFSQKTVSRAKTDLRKAGAIQFRSTGKGKDKKHFTVLVSD